MNREKITLFWVVIFVSLIAITTTAFFAKPELNKTVILRLMK